MILWIHELITSNQVGSWRFSAAPYGAVRQRSGNRGGRAALPIEIIFVIIAVIIITIVVVVTVVTVVAAAEIFGIV